jgi:hypothetical protein
MVGLARELVTTIVSEYDAQEVLKRLSDPFWFQAFGCVLGFDWHSSGLTTTACGALKEALRDLGGELGLFVAGGKGKTSRQTPREIEELGDRFALSGDAGKLVYASRMAAKVDSAAVQDGYQIYHHTFVFTREGSWAVVQQGMNEAARYARRYHWLSDGLSDFVREPHFAIISDPNPGSPILNMVAQEGEGCRNTSSALAREKPQSLVRELEKMRLLELPSRHAILAQDLHPNTLERVFLKTYESQPADFETLLGLPGVGAKSIRALALIADLVHGDRISFRDPARFAFAHGGKDGHPYPVDRKNYDHSIQFLREALEKAKVGERERLEGLRRLARLSRGG